MGFQLHGHVSGQAIAPGFAHPVGHPKDVGQPTPRGKGTDQPLLAGHHQAGGIDAGQVVAPQAHGIAGIPKVGLRLPKGLAVGGPEGGHPGVGIVHQQIELAVLLGLDALKQGADLVIVAVVHGQGQGHSASLGDGGGGFVEAAHRFSCCGQGATGDVDRGPGLP